VIKDHFLFIFLNTHAFDAFSTQKRYSRTEIQPDKYIPGKEIL